MYLLAQVWLCLSVTPRIEHDAGLRAVVGVDHNGHVKPHGTGTTPGWAAHSAHDMYRASEEALLDLGTSDRKTPQLTDVTKEAVKDFVADDSESDELATVAEIGHLAENIEKNEGKLADMTKDVNEVGPRIEKAMKDIETDEKLLHQEEAELAKADAKKNGAAAALLALAQLF